MNINEIATKAASIRKPNKVQAHDILKQIAADPGSDYAIEQLIPKLYAYFMPSAPARPKNRLEFAAKFINQKDIRNYLHFFHVSGGHITATDGHRLIKFKSSLPDGFYDTALQSIEANGMIYPDVDRIIPDISTMLQYTIPVDLHGLPVEPMAKGKGYIVTVQGVKLDQKYLRDALCFTKDQEVSIYLAQDANGQPVSNAVRLVLHSQPDTVIVIMPLRD